MCVAFCMCVCVCSEQPSICISNQSLLSGVRLHSEALHLQIGMQEKPSKYTLGVILTRGVEQPVFAMVTKPNTLHT